MKGKGKWIIGLFTILLVIGYACEDEENDLVRFNTQLEGENEVPAVETNAQGGGNLRDKQ